MRMIRTLLMITTLAPPLCAQAGGELALRAAIETETVKGDIKVALRQYAEIASKYAKSDRATAASALIHLAECREKMGDAEARKIYERVLREYPDQKGTAAIAQTRLRTTSPVKGDRAIWTGSKVDLLGRVSSDGRLISFTDWSNGAALAVHDLRTGSDRQLAQAGFAPSGYIGWAQFSTFSKDGKHIAYEWYGSKNQVEIRVVPVEDGGNTEPRLVFANPDVASINVSDWSPDGKWLAVHLRRKDRSSQIALVAADNGELRVLKTVGWRGPSRLFFSPDGTHIAYDLPVSETGEHRNIFVMAADGSRETAVVAHPGQNLIMGWTPDGKTLVFSSDRTGAMALWALGVTTGKALGSPRQVKSEGPDWSLGLTNAGALVVFKAVGNEDVRVAALDVSTGKISEIPGPAPNYIASRGRPDWSWDGRHLS